MRSKSTVARSPLVVALGSMNPAKTNGAKNIFRAYFPRCRFVELDVSVIIRSQPIGIEQVVEGALLRSIFALSETKADFGVGVEAGIMTLPRRGKHINIQAAVVMDKEGRCGTGLSSGFEIPAWVLRRIKEDGTELDRYSHELTRAPKISEEEGIVYHLTKGRTSRLQMTEQCVGMALVPWLNETQYHENHSGREKRRATVERVGPRESKKARRRKKQ